MAALLWFTSRRELMGVHRNGVLTGSLAVLSAGVVVVLNVVLLVQASRWGPPGKCRVRVVVGKNAYKRRWSGKNARPRKKDSAADATFSGHRRSVCRCGVSARVARVMHRAGKVFKPTKGSRPVRADVFARKPVRDPRASGRSLGHDPAADGFPR